MTYTRVHRAPPELLFDCMTTPEHLTHFWGPTGTVTPVDKITVDLRPGGAFVTTMVDEASGEEYTMTAVYAVIDRPGRLVWTEPDVEGGMATTITFVDLGDGRTEITTHQTNVPAMYLRPRPRPGSRPASTASTSTSGTSRAEGQPDSSEPRIATKLTISPG